MYIDLLYFWRRGI